MEEEWVLKDRIERHQQKIFALVLYLIGGNRDKAYEIAASTFVQAIRQTPEHEDENMLLARLAGIAIEKAQKIKAVPSFDESDFKDLPSGKQKSLNLVRRAIQLLPYETRALLLLRDQMHMPCTNIASILNISENDVRSQLAQAQVHFRKKIEEVLIRG